MFDDKRRLGKFQDVRYPFYGSVQDQLVKLPDNFPCLFDMRNLVFSYWNQSRLTKGNISRLTYGVAQESVIHIVKSTFCGFRFV